MKRWTFEVSAEVTRTLEVEAESWSKAEAAAVDLFHERCSEFRVIGFTHMRLKQGTE